MRGRHIKRWQIEDSREYLVWAYQGIPIARYSAILRHLEKFREQLADRWEPSRGQCEWYELRPCDFYEEFSRPKIVYPHFNTTPNFAYDQSGALTNDKTYIIPDAPLHLLGILNSSVVGFFLNQICPSVQQGYLEFRVIYMEQIPIPSASADQEAAITAVVNKLVDSKGQGPQVTQWERELNALVYELYELTEDEIAIVEGRV